MALERTLSLIKPDATKRNITGEICDMIEKANLRIIAQKRLCLTKEQAENFYGDHKGKDFFEPLVEFIISASVVAQVLEGEEAIRSYRELMGATDPQKAKEGTLRKKYALNSRQNSVHGSDSKENAEREISFFFSQLEIMG